MENNSVGLKSGALSFRIVFPIGLLSNVNLLDWQVGLPLPHSSQICCGITEVMAGKSIKADGTSKRFSFAYCYDTKPLRSSFEFSLL